MADGPRAWEQALSVEGDRYTFTVTPNRGAETFQPVNTNGSRRGGRTIVAYLPHRIGAAEILKGADLKPVITDDFLLIPNPVTRVPDRTYQIEFRARPLKP
jgi:hypothetical protein